MSNYPKSKGAVWPNDHKSEDKHPDFRGKLVVTKEQINKLIEMGKAGMEPTMQIGAWKRTSEAGQRYIFLSSEVYVKEENTDQDGWGDESSDSWGSPKPTPSNAGFDDDDIPF